MFARICWLWWKQGSTFHSSTDAEIVALDAAVRMDGLPLMDFWDIVLDVFASHNKDKGNRQQQHQQQHSHTVLTSDIDELLNADYVPSNPKALPQRTT